MVSLHHPAERLFFLNKTGCGLFLRARGFSLIEIIVVLALMVVVVSMAVPMLVQGTSDSGLKNAARQLASGARLARSQAVAERREMFLLINLEEKYFKVGQRKEQALPEDVDLQLFTAQNDVISETTGGIRFFPDGGSNGGRVTLSLGEGKGQYEVDVDWLTGRVSILE